MNTHVLYAKTRRGSTIELGHVASLEVAVRLQRSIDAGCGRGYGCFVVFERDEGSASVNAIEDALRRDHLRSSTSAPVVVGSVRYEELRTRRDR